LVGEAKTAIIEDVFFFYYSVLRARNFAAEPFHLKTVPNSLWGVLALVLSHLVASGGSFGLDWKSNCELHRQRDRFYCTIYYALRGYSLILTRVETVGTLVLTGATGIVPRWIFPLAAG
jgi:hypothetical protein